jgi:hypothetical protein
MILALINRTVKKVGTHAGLTNPSHLLLIYNDLFDKRRQHRCAHAAAHSHQKFNKPLTFEV